jgi:cytochrome P450
MNELQDLMHQLVTGGFETTTSAIATGMWLLIRYPYQLAKLRANPALLDVAGTMIPEGADVMVRFAAANRDAAKFADPDVFDVERPNASEHVAFGFGNHCCVGAWLARSELRTAFTVLLERLDGFELARPLDDVAHQVSFFLHPLKELPIRFTVRAR